MPAVPIKVAARELRITPSQVRRWIQAGAPVASAARPMRVDIEALRLWRAGGDPVTALAGAFLDTLRRDCGEGMPVSRLLGIEDRRAAALLLVAFDRCCLALTGSESAAPWPAAIQALRAIAGS